VMSSFESISATLPQSDWSVHAKPMSQRNYPCDNIIYVYWGTQNLNLTGEVAFKKQLFQCILGQALLIKSNIEGKRSGNIFGVLTWQFNEIWPTGGWGSVEYGTPVAGQVIGGRWKPLHHFLQSSVYADVMATCGNNANCYIRNDGITPFSGTIDISAVQFSNGKVTPIISAMNVSLPAGAAATHWFCLRNSGGSCSAWNVILPTVGCMQTGVDCVTTVTVKNSGGGVVSSHVLPLVTPNRMTLPKADVTFTVKQDTSGGADITLSTNAVAIYATLTTEANGRFSENSILLLPGQRMVKFMPFGSLDLQKLTSTLRVEHAQQYI